MTRKEKAAETEAVLKEAARRVIACRGYLNTKISDITAAAGRATGSFYNHFASKEALLEALLQDLLAEADKIPREDVEHPADLGTIESIRWHVEAWWRFYKAHLPEMVAIKQAAMVDPELGRRLQRIVAADAEHMLSHLDALPGPRPDPRLQLSAVNTLLDGFAYTWLVVNPANGDTVSDADAIDLLTNMLHHGLVGEAPR